MTVAPGALAPAASAARPLNPGPGLRRRRGAGRDRLVRLVLKPAVFAVCLVPLVLLVWKAQTGGLGVNPIEAAIRFLGDWALRFLLISLAVSPLKEIFGWTLLMRFRRMLGLFAFFYVTLHLSGYVGVDQFFAWGLIWEDIVKRPFITIGMTGFVLLIPLAATSTAGMIKRLGAKRWKRLHMLVYLTAMLGVLHYFMMVKADVREPLIHATVLALLLGWRAATRWLPKPSRTASAPPSVSLAAGASDR